MTARPIVALAVLLAACGTTSENPAFESTEVSEVQVFGGDCAAKRCIQVVAPVGGTKHGEGSCALFGPGDPDFLEPIAESGSLEMEPGEDVVWEVKLPDDAPPTSKLNPVCHPMAEG